MSEGGADESARLFFALWPDESVRQAVLPYRPDKGRVVLPENWHITLVFLGEVALRRLPELTAGAGEIVASRFELELALLGHWRRPQVSWLGPEHVPPPLVDLHAKLCALAELCELPVERRSYAPHLTLARRAQPHALRRIPPIPWRVEHFCLVRSHAEATGPRYRILERWALSAV